MAQKTFFITGSTGLVGTEVVASLLATTESLIYVLVRAASDAEAKHRLHALWQDTPMMSGSIGIRVFPVIGDITHEGLHLTPAKKDLLLTTTTHVIHCAAETGVQKSKYELWRINVEGTRRIVELAKEMTCLERLVHVSTAYVAGTRKGTVLEDDPLPSHFNSLYEQSKAEAECLVRSSGLPFTICRPGMIVGHSLTGRTHYFNTIYYVLKLMLQGKMRWLPIHAHQLVNVEPADYVGQLVATLALHPEAEGKTFHLTAPTQQVPCADELIQAVREWAKAHLQIDVPQPLYLPMPWMRFVGRLHNAGKGEKRHGFLSNLAALMPYFLDNHHFDRSNTDRLTHLPQPKWRTYLPALLEFACRQNFMRQTDLSIFQQAMIRRKSHRYPITYFDIKSSGIERITGRQMNALVGKFVARLRQLGVQKGDAVAFSGINCAAHAALDNAIGLVGAISVPIYYTTPAHEIALLLRKSAARWFFVGDERIANNLGEVPSEVAIIPFGPLEKSGVEEPPADLPALDKSEMISPTALATIRYTSGTTGDPKGVMFSFSQLKWMGQVLTNLLPWRDRNSHMRYLSFLPMSHVVEGILAAYAPYCMLCKAEIYYLNDFQMLTKVLPKVRPTVFFSVPRFYEKMWEQIERHPIGQRYLKLNDGWQKKLLATILRRAVMRKAGLDRCSQLLVGSAPISEDLLLRFRHLGIEIYNAYGQTEAPLVTLNRLGDNVIPSIGTPLPDTKVTTAADGELIVSGPQVALGYYQLESDTFRDGLLHTGDLGHIDDRGHVYIAGRKKDMLITSYGKNINRTKIEQRLCDIPCVEQAVLVGEQRPYCTALLWTNGPTDTLQADIDRMNESLSHPEQVKRWHVVATPLSIKNGELTPNLKVKHQVVIQHYQQAIDEMYQQ